MASRSNAFRYAQYDRKPAPFVFRHRCGICGHPIRAGRGHEHKDCLAEIDRRADAAIPNPRRKA